MYYAFQSATIIIIIIIIIVINISVDIVLYQVLYGHFMWSFDMVIYMVNQILKHQLWTQIIFVHWDQFVLSKAHQFYSRDSRVLLQ